MSKVLLAGVGNVFAADDGFGVAVAHAARDRTFSVPITVRDVGIRTLHLAYELTEPWSLCVIADAIPYRTAVGTLHLIEPSSATPAVRQYDGHGMDLAAVLSTVHALGARPPQILILGCEVADTSARMSLGLSVRAAVERAVAMIDEILSRHSASDEGSRTDEEAPQRG